MWNVPSASTGKKVTPKMVNLLYWLKWSRWFWLRWWWSYDEFQYHFNEVTAIGLSLVRRKGQLPPGFTCYRSEIISTPANLYAIEKREKKKRNSPWQEGPNANRFLPFHQVNFAFIIEQLSRKEHKHLHVGWKAKKKEKKKLMKMHGDYRSQGN